MVDFRLKIGWNRIVHNLLLILLVSTGLRAQLPQQEDVVAQQADSAGAQQAEEVEEFDVTVGYNLKVIVRLAPVYSEPSLISPIVAHLPKNSVVAVTKEEDRWYRIAFGSEEDNQRQAGWVVSYGVERTHELEFIVTSTADASRYEGQKVIVVSGEAAVRSFPSPQAGLLMNVYRDEVFEVTGESKDYYRIILSKSVQGWIWKGDIDDYIEPKYSREEVKEMRAKSSQQIERLQDLNDLLGEIRQQSEQIDLDIEELTRLEAEKVAAEEAAISKDIEPSFFDYESLKKRSHLSFGIQRQGFAGKIGLSPGMLMGIGFGFDWNERLKLDFSICSGSPAIRALGAEQPDLPSGMADLDTLAVSVSIMRFGLRYPVKAPKFPLLKGMDHYLYCGMQRMSLKPTAGGINNQQNLWGGVFAWGMNKPLFGRLRLDIALNYFITRADVTDIRESGRGLLQSKKVFLRNSGFTGGVIWDF
jgi:Bacterial SH3 domain